jgi:hypothetical protein
LTPLSSIQTIKIIHSIHPITADMPPQDIPPDFNISNYISSLESNSIDPSLFRPKSRVENHTSNKFGPTTDGRVKCRKGCQQTFSAKGNARKHERNETLTCISERSLAWEYKEFEFKRGTLWRCRIGCPELSLTEWACKLHETKRCPLKLYEEECYQRLKEAQATREEAAREEAAREEPNREEANSEGVDREKPDREEADGEGVDREEVMQRQIEHFDDQESTYSQRSPDHWLFNYSFYQ